jgi:hypothetical protein
VIGDRRGEDRGHIDVGGREAKSRDGAEQPGFREWHQRLGYARGNRERLVGRCRQCRFLGAADADAHAVRGGELLHRCSGILPAEHGSQETRRVDAVRQRYRGRRDPEEDQDRASVAVPGQCPEIAEPVGGDTPAQSVQLADQFRPQPCCLFHIVANRTQQQRLAAVGEGRMLRRRGYVVRLDRQRENPLRHRGTQHPVAGGDIRHLPGLRLVQLIAPHLRPAWCGLRNLAPLGPALPLLAQPVQLHIPL